MLAYLRFVEEQLVKFNSTLHDQALRMKEVGNDSHKRWFRIMDHLGQALYEIREIIKEGQWPK